MPRILVDPARLQARASDLRSVEQELRRIRDWLGHALSGIDLEVQRYGPVDQQVAQAAALSRTLAERADSLAGYLTNKAQAFEAADAQGADDLDKAFKATPLPAPLATPKPGGLAALSPEQVVDWLNDLLRPIDMADKLGAEKQFRLVMEEIGRQLNQANHTVGNIKAAGQLTDFLFGTTKALGAIGNLLTLNDYRRYINGALTNQQVARIAITTLFPPAVVNALVGPTGPILDIGGKIVDWLVNNVPDPNGHWQGLAPPAGG